MELELVSDLLKKPEAYRQQYLIELQKQDAKTIWKQMSFYWEETIEDLHYRVIIMWFIPMEDLTKFDQVFVKLYDKKI